MVSVLVENAISPIKVALEPVALGDFRRASTLPWAFLISQTKPSAPAH
jgi:hypothetical protein